MRDELRARKVLGSRFDEISIFFFDSFLNDLQRSEAPARDHIASDECADVERLRSLFIGELKLVLMERRSIITSQLDALVAENAAVRLQIDADQQHDFWSTLAPFVEMKLRNVKYQSEPQQRAGLYSDEGTARREIADGLAVTLCLADAEVRERVYNTINNEQRRARQIIQSAESVGWEFLARRAAVSSSELQRRQLIADQQLDFWSLLSQTIDDSSPLRSRAASAAMANLAGVRAGGAARPQPASPIQIPERLVTVTSKHPQQEPQLQAQVDDAVKRTPMPKRPISAVLPQRPAGAALPARPVSSRLRREQQIFDSRQVDQKASATVQDASTSRPASVSFAGLGTRPDSTYSDYGIYSSDSPNHGSDHEGSPDSAGQHLRFLYRTLHHSIAKELEDTQPTANPQQQQNLKISLEDLKDALYAIPTFKLSPTAHAGEQVRLAALWCDPIFSCALLSKLELLLAGGSAGSALAVSPFLKPAVPSFTIGEICYATLGAIPMALELVPELEFSEFCAELAVNGLRKLSHLKRHRHGHVLRTAFAALDIHRSRLIPRSLFESVFSGQLGAENSNFHLVCRYMNGFSFVGFAALLIELRLDDPLTLEPILIERFYDRFVWTRIQSASAKREKLVQLGLLQSQMRSAAEELLVALNLALAPIPGNKHRTFAPEEDYAASRLVCSLDTALSPRDSRVFLDFAVMALSCGFFYPQLDPVKGRAFVELVASHANFNIPTSSRRGKDAVLGPSSFLRSSVLADLWQHLSSSSFLDDLARMSGRNEKGGQPSSGASIGKLLQFGQVTADIVEFFANQKLEVPESLAANDRAQVDLYRYKRIQHVNAVFTGLRHLLISCAACSKFWRFSKSSSSVNATRSLFPTDEELAASEVELAHQIKFCILASVEATSPFVITSPVLGADEDDSYDQQEPVISGRFAEILFGLGGSGGNSNIPFSPPSQHSERASAVSQLQPPAPVRPAWASPRAPADHQDGSDKKRTALTDDGPRQNVVSSTATASANLATVVARPASAAATTGITHTGQFALPKTFPDQQPDGSPTSPPVQVATAAVRPQSALHVPASTPPPGARPSSSSYIRQSNVSPAPAASISNNNNKSNKTAVAPTQPSHQSKIALASAGSPAVKELLRIFAQPATAACVVGHTGEGTISSSSSKAEVFYMVPRHPTPKH